MLHANWLIFEIEFWVNGGFGFPCIQKCIKSIVFWVGRFQQSNISTAHCYRWLQFIYKLASLHAYNIPVFLAKSVEKLYYFYKKINTFIQIIHNGSYTIWIICIAETILHFQQKEW